MRQNQIMFYNTSIDEVMELFDMETKKDPASIDLEDYQVKLNKRGDHTLITIEHALSGTTVDDGILALKMEFPHLWVDNESIARVKRVFDLNPSSQFWKDILNDLHLGTPLHYRVEEILEETEERLDNPDPYILGLFEKAEDRNFHNRFFISLRSQFLSGRELSEKQIAALENMANGVSRGVSPLVSLLNDLTNNVSLDRADFMLVVKAKKNLDVLDDEERKRLRHLIYRNERRLTNNYSKDQVRTLLKKGNVMRHKSASEIIRDLESRIARLEASTRMASTRKASTRMVELTTDAEDAERAWPDVTYRGKEVQEIILREESDLLYHLQRNLDLQDNYGNDVELEDGQAVYLGYNPKTDVFCMGFDLEGRISEYSMTEYDEKMEEYEEDPEENDEPEEPVAEELSGYVVFKYDVNRRKIEILDYDGAEQNLFYPYLYGRLPRGFEDVRLD